ELGVFELVDLLRAETHRGRGIEQEEDLRVGLTAIALEVAALGAREDVPIDVAEIVAFGVGAVFGELLGETEVGGAVHAGYEGVDDGFGYKVKRGNRGQRGWV